MIMHLKLVPMLGILGVTMLITRKPDKRASVVKAAMGEVGSNDAQKYWDVVLPGLGTIASNISWCGGFALWAVKQAGLAPDWTWEIGKGFLYKLPITYSPQPGDIAYYAKYQHHAVVRSINPDGTVSLINGNGTDGKVSLSTTAPSNVSAFYSIQPLVDAA